MLIFTADVIHLASNMSVVASCGGWRARCSASAAWPVVVMIMSVRKKMVVTDMVMFR